MTHTLNRNKKVVAGLRRAVVALVHAEKQDHEAGGWVWLMAYA